MFYILELKKSRNLIFSLMAMVSLPVRFDLVHLIFGKSEIMGKFVQDGFPQDAAKGLARFCHVVENRRTIDDDDIRQLAGEIMHAFRQRTTAIETQKVPPVRNSHLFQRVSVGPLLNLKDDVVDSTAEDGRQTGNGTLDGPFKLEAVQSSNPCPLAMRKTAREVATSRPSSSTITASPLNLRFSGPLTEAIAVT